MDQACDRFEVAWKQAAEKGAPPRLEEFLGESPDGDRPVLLGELLAVEFHYRVQAGETPTPEEYHERFPDYPKIVKGAFQRSAIIAWGVDNKSSQRVPETVAGYEILEELGRGGMGVVYKARQIGLKRLVALKMILSGSYADAAEVARFRTEAEAVARLQHPNIVQIYEIGEHKGLPFFSLEYVDGGSLAGKLRGTPLTAKAAARVVHTLAGAMQAAHEHGIIHRDLKPANVLLTVVSSPSTVVNKHKGAGDEPRATDDGHIPKIADFGLAKKLEEAGQTQSGAVMGTPSYMAPEQAEGKKDIGPLADVYALGAILYECLTGRPPFKGPTPIDTIRQVLGDEPVPPARLRPGLPRDVETICLKCLQKQPHKRYASALELAEDLRRFQAGEPIRARPVNTLERSWRWCRRNPSLAAAGGLAGVAVVAALVLLSLYARQQEQAANQLAEEQRQTKTALKNANQNLALLTLDRALGIFEKGELGDGAGDAHKGLLWLARALEIAPADDERLQHVIRANLAAWRTATHALERTFDGGGNRALALSDGGGTRALALSPDGKIIAAGHDRSAGLWDRTTGQQIGQSMVHDGPVEALAFSPRGETLATGGWDNTVYLWSTATQALRARIATRDVVKAVIFSRDGKAVVAGCRSGAVYFVDAATGIAQGEPLTAGGAVCSLAFSPDGKLLAAACEDEGFKGHVQFWDAATRNAHGPPLPHPGPVYDAAFFPDGKKLLTATGAGLFCWDMRTQQLLAKFAEDRGGRYIAFSPDGQTCAIGGNDRSVRFSNVAALDRPLGLPIWHSHTLGRLLFTPDGSALLTSSMHDNVREWEVPRLREQTMPFPNKRPSPPRLHSWSGIRDGLRCLAISPDGKRLLAADWEQSVRLWDLDSGQPLNFVLKHDDVVLTACFDAAGRVILTGSTDHTARRWDAATGKLIGKPWKLQGPVITVALSPDGQTAFTGIHLLPAGKDNSAQLWDVVTGQPLRKVRDSSGNMSAAVFSRDGKTLWTGGWQDLEQWDVAAPREPRVRFAAHVGGITAMARSPDGEMLATSSLDLTVRLWTSVAGKPLGLPFVHKGWVQQVAFSHDGKLVVTACTDSKARVWDVATGRSVGPALDHPLPVHAAIFTRDGKWIVTRSEEPFLRRWKALGLAKGDVQRIVLWTQVLTGMELDADGAVRTLGVDDWRRRRQQLKALGGSPAPAAAAGFGD